MAIRFSRHSRRQMKWRRISEDEVAKVLAAPDRTEQSIEQRKNVYKLINGRLLKVTYTEEGSDVIIITVIDKTGRRERT
ncbi:MAG: DUF4258 domain-containing protein [Nitrospira sp.]|nr:MAG: DUF4258 domain-containing protein [Nitrospira sp.]